MQFNVRAGCPGNRLRAAVAIAAALTVGSCGGGGNETPTSPSAGLSPLPGGATVSDSQGGDATTDPTSEVQASTKVGLCHRQGNDLYHFIEVNSSAEPAHLAHGDAPLFAPVPGQPGKFFNKACEVVDFCPECPITRTVTAG